MESLSKEGRPSTSTDPNFSRMTMKKDKGNSTSGRYYLELKPNKYFKCHVFMHISSDCPTRNIISFIEKVDDEEKESV